MRAGIHDTFFPWKSLDFDYFLNGFEKTIPGEYSFPGESSRDLFGMVE